jgi:UrcA family protein
LGVRYSFRAIPTYAEPAHIRAVDHKTALIKEIAMNKFMATTARALTISIAATMAFNAASASTDGVSKVQSMANEYLTYVVPFSDLDVSKIEGAKTLYTRLRYAAKVVCEPLESVSSWGYARHRACMDKAIADAVASVDRPLLSQYHQLRTKGEKAGLVQLAKSN